MEWLLLILGLLLVAFLHLIIPICIAASKKLFKKKVLWIISTVGGLFGFIICAIMQEEFRGLAGLIQSVFWTLISFLILKKKCYAIADDDKQIRSVHITKCTSCGYQSKKFFNACPKCGERNKQILCYDEKNNFANQSNENSLHDIMDEYAKATIEDMKANQKNQPDNENDIDFGLVAEKPIFTHALKSVEGEKDYLNTLYTSKGEKIKYNRTCSISVEGINGIIDVYDTYLPSGEFYKTIYINMYGPKTSTQAPVGFILKNATRQDSVRSAKLMKTKYCKRCGAVIDNTTKVCTECGKQYFKLTYKPLLSIILTVLMCYFVLLGYSYFHFSKSLNAGEFIKAETYFNLIPFGEKLFSARYEYLSAGILMEEGEYIKSYKAFKEIKDFSVPSSVSQELKSKIYSLGQKAYREGEYSSAKNHFNTIPNYKRSSDYLLLINCCDESFSAWSFANEHYDELLNLLNEEFENVNEVILLQSDLLEKFLTARWENGDTYNPYYFEIDDNGATYNLPYKDAEGYYYLSNGIYKVGETESEAIKCYRFTIIDEDTISIYCYKDGSTHKLFRQ